MKITKTDFIIFEDCGKNAWLKIHKPEIYKKNTLSSFELSVIETGNEVDEMARELFPGGYLVENRDDAELTLNLIKKKEKVIYQPVFETEKFKAISDILVWNQFAEKYDLYEVKSSNSGEGKGAKDKIYTKDLAFQKKVLQDLNIPINHFYLIRLNSQYIRGVDLDIEDLFSKEIFDEKINEGFDDIVLEMKNAYGVLSNKKEPAGNCKCILKGRSGHCTTFSYSNPEIPKYSVHDITRIGMSKKKLAELVDSKIFEITDVPMEFPLTDKQKNQVDAAKTGSIITEDEEIKMFLDTIKYPISFLDYETFAGAIPRFVGYKTFNQIPFQFSLHVSHDEKTEPDHFEFIFTKNENPDLHFIKAMQDSIPEKGSVISWHKSFEIGRNRDLANRNPKYASYLEDINNRMIDLEDIFKNQWYIHPDFKGKTSIKFILPVLAKELSYKELDVKEGATASDTWNKISQGKYNLEEEQNKIAALLKYCKLDTYAMYAIWRELVKLVK